MNQQKLGKIKKLKKDTKDACHHTKTLKNQIHLGSLLLHKDDPERKTIHTFVTKGITTEKRLCMDFQKHTRIKKNKKKPTWRGTEWMEVCETQEGGAGRNSINTAEILLCCGNGVAWV